MAVKSLGRPLVTSKMFKDWKKAGEYAQIASREYGASRTEFDPTAANKNGWVCMVIVWFDSLHQLEIFEKEQN